MAMSATNSFGTRDKLNVGAQSFEIYRLEHLERHGTENMSRLPFSLRILLENLLRNEDGRFVHPEDIEALASWKPGCVEKEIAFMPARVLLQDFTGVPAVVDLAAMREAVKKMGGNPKRINPLFPAELVIDHSVQVDSFGNVNAFGLNAYLAGALAESKQKRRCWASQVQCWCRQWWDSSCTENCRGARQLRILC
jgi:aconitate hydratase